MMLGACWCTRARATREKPLAALVPVPEEVGLGLSSRRREKLGRTAGRAASCVTVLVALLAGQAGTARPAWAKTPAARPAQSQASVAQSQAGAAQLLTSLRLEEDQLAGLQAYRLARSYLSRARLVAASATRAVQVADRALLVARARWGLAVRAEDAAQVVATRYRQAVHSLAMAEYTGAVNVPAGLDYASLQARLEDAVITEVTGSDALAAWQLALDRLEVARASADRAHRQAELAWAADEQARQRLGAAQARVQSSARAVVLARRWATVPGAAPPAPVARLAVVEAKVPGPRWPSRSLAQVPGGRGDELYAASLGPRAAGPVAGPPARPKARRGGASPAQPVLLGPSILGPSLLSPSDLEGWFSSTRSRAATTVPLPQLVSYYYAAARQTHVRADLAFAQSVVETGYFSFPPGGQLRAGDNNFAGIGACGSCKRGWSFPTAQEGVLDQEELLQAYASRRGSPLASWVRGLGVQGCCHTWLSLSGIWASNRSYGYEILSVYSLMVSWAVEPGLQVEGLAPAPAVPAPLGLMTAQERAGS